MAAWTSWLDDALVAHAEAPAAISPGRPPAPGPKRPHGLSRQKFFATALTMRTNRVVFVSGPFTTPQRRPTDRPLNEHQLH